MSDGAALVGSSYDSARNRREGNGLKTTSLSGEVASWSHACKRQYALSIFLDQYLHYINRVGGCSAHDSSKKTSTEDARDDLKDESVRCH